jgi:ketosteroid isomerase-like protein
MTMATKTKFDIEELKRAYEEWDVETLRSLYADDLEQIEMDHVTPPSAPRRRTKADFEGIFERAPKNGVRFYVDNPVVGEDKAACTLTCVLPSGKKVIANSIMDIRDGQIVRQFDIQAMDEPSE